MITWLIRNICDRHSKFKQIIFNSGKHCTLETDQRQTKAALCRNFRVYSYNVCIKCADSV